jgi:tetratricopeptide (TPR) repeat protein
MKKDLIVFCRVAWMKHYRGITQYDVPRNGGSFVSENNDAHESQNFLPYNHFCHGFTMHRGETLNLSRIAGSQIQSDVLEDVTVVWVARNLAGKNYIVGWYEHATAYRDCQTLPEPTRENNTVMQDYWFKAQEENCVLLPETARSFEIPMATTGMVGQGMGQSNVWYANADAAAPLKQRVLDYIRNYNGVRISVSHTAEDLKRCAADKGQSPEELLKLAKEIPDSYEALLNVNLLLEKEYSAEALRIRAIILMELHCYTEAAEAFRRYLYEEKDDIPCMQDLMYSEIMMSHGLIAIEIGTKLLNLMDDCEDKQRVFHNMMVIYICNGERDNALSLLNKYRSLAEKYNTENLKWYEEELFHK